MEFVLGRFSHFNIEIAYSNSTFCGTWMPRFCEFTWKLSTFRQNEHTPEAILPIDGFSRQSWILFSTLCMCNYHLHLVNTEIPSIWAELMTLTESCAILISEALIDSALIFCTKRKRNCYILLRFILTSTFLFPTNNQLVSFLFRSLW